MTQPTGQIFIVAAPSGGGKTSLVKALVETLPDIEVSVSHTTRDQRSGEEEGRHYFFVTETAFLDMIAAGAFIEHATVYGHYYGTSVAQIQQRLHAGIDVVLDIDWQGAAQIRRFFPEAVSIFILPPSLQALRERLSHRRRDAAHIIEQRMAQATQDIQHFSEFDYLVVNDTFEHAASVLQSIVTASRARQPIQATRYRELLSFLLSEQ